MTKKNEIHLSLSLLACSSLLFFVDFFAYFYYITFESGWGSFTYIYFFIFAFMPGFLAYIAYLFLLVKKRKRISDLKGYEKFLAGIGVAAVGWKVVGVLLTTLGIA